MKVWRGDPRYWGPGPATGTVLSIGVFDGIHRGHQFLLTCLGARARALADLPIGVVTFDTHPRALLNPDQAPKTLMAVSRRLEVLESMGVDQVGILPFGKIHHLEPDQFVHQVVVNGFNGRLVMVGKGFRYGAGRSGSVTSLKESGRRRGFIVEARDLFQEGSTPISSSMIRKFITQGEVAAARHLLGRPHELQPLRGVGHLKDSDLGTATADLDFDPAMAVPAPGVYAVRMIAGGRERPGICLIRRSAGTEGASGPAQIHLPDRRGLGRSENTLTVRFLERVRKLPSRTVAPSASTVLRQDISTARELLI